MKHHVTSMDLIVQTLEYISDKGYGYNIGFVDVRKLWHELGVPKTAQISIQQTLVINECVRLAYDRPYSFEITNPKGVSILRKLKTSENIDDFDLSFIEQTITLRAPNRFKIYLFGIKIWWKRVAYNPWGLTIVGGLIVSIIGGLIALVWGTIYLVQHHIIH